MTKYIIKDIFTTKVGKRFAVFKVGLFRDTYICTKDSIEECNDVIQHLEQVPKV